MAPNGGPAAWVSCTHDQGACYDLAGKLCPSGYFVLRDDGSVVGETAHGVAWGGQSAAAARVETERNYEGHLFVQCRPTDSAQR